MQDIPSHRAKRKVPEQLPRRARPSLLTHFQRFNSGAAPPSAKRGRGPARLMKTAGKKFGKILAHGFSQAYEDPSGI